MLRFDASTTTWYGASEPGAVGLPYECSITHATNASDS